MLDLASHKCEISLYNPHPPRPTHEAATALRHETTVEGLIQALTEPVEARAKHEAPAWSPFAYSGERRLAREAEAVCALVYDLDHCTHTQLSALSDALERTGYLYAMHETWTRGRYRLCLPLASALEPRAYPAAWEAAARELGVWESIDQACSDLARLYYAPSHPPGEARFTCTDGTRWYEPPKGGGISISGKKHSPKILASPEISTAPVDLGALRAEIQNRSDDKVAGLLALVEGTLRVPRGERENTLHPLISALAWCRNAPSDDVARAMFERVLSAREGAETQLEEWVEKAMHSYARGRERKVDRDTASAEVEKFFRPSDSSDEWKAGLKFKTGKDGAVLGLKPNELNLLAVLRNDERFRGHIRWNMLKQAIEVDAPALRIHENARESFDVPMAAWFQGSEYNCEAGRDLLGACAQHVALENPYDPVREYLTKLPAWDGVARASTTLTQYAKSEGNPAFVRMITRKFLIAAVARAMDPGCQVDNVLVLQGGQGGGKTSFVRTMGAGFHVETSLDLHNKDAVMTAAGNWLVELGELASLRKSDVESVRNFITRKEDQLRLPYGRTIRTMPRRCVFIGTTNSRQPLTDPEGNRRFWVVSVGKVDTAALALVRDQIWAEALHAYRSGEVWHLNDAEAQLAKEEAQVYEAEDVTSSELLHWLDSQTTWPKYLSAGEVAAKVLHRMVGSLTPQESAAINRTMDSLGWKRARRRVAGKPTYVYEVPTRETMERMWA